jgi:inorganic pyrophosphatase
LKIRLANTRFANAIAENSADRCLHLPAHQLIVMDRFNPWHHVSLGENTPEIINGIIEIPKNSRAKYELDKDSGLLMLDRVLYSSVYYPANYGFIPQTYCDDKDPLDILVLSQIEVVPLCIVPAKVIGVMRMLDQGEADDKIIAVAQHDMSWNHYNDISELPDHFKNEIQNFFEDYKKLEHKTVVVHDFMDKKVAIEIVEKAIQDYKIKFNLA